MLAFILAIAVGLASVFFFLSAFFAPKLHRKDDFLWSGVGFFYALVLWLCATRITGGVLLGQGAAVVLILSFTWQTIKLRAALANLETAGTKADFSLLDWVGGGLNRSKTGVKTSKISSKTPTPGVTPATLETSVASAKSVDTETPEAIAEPGEQTEELVEKNQEIVAATSPTEIVERVAETVSKTEINPEAILPVVEKPTLATKPKKPGFFSGLFSKKSTTPKVATPPKTSNSNLIQALDAVEIEEETEDWDETEAIEQPELAVESVTIEVVETITFTPEQTEAELDDLLEDDQPAEVEETQTIVSSENETTEAEKAIVTSITGLSNMLDTYDENSDEFEPYLGGQETATALESNPNKLDLPVAEENTTKETLPPEVNSD
ncbi:MAG: Ycf66 family protein [Microcystaceae cyanobacterium]